MAGYVSPVVTHNPTPGLVIPAAWGDAVDTGLDYLASLKAHCRVYNNANISIATSGTPQVLTFNSERYDVGACHSTSSNTSRLTVPTGQDGVYAGGCNVRFAANGTGYRLVEILLNGATVIAAARHVPTAEFYPIALPFQYALVATDYVEVRVTQNSGGALNVEVAGNYSPEFYMMWTST